MTDKEVQKLGKKDLVEILYYLSQQNNELKKENEQLKIRLNALVDEAIAAKKEATPAELPESQNIKKNDNG